MNCWIDIFRWKIEMWRLSGAGADVAAGGDGDAADDDDHDHDV